MESPIVDHAEQIQYEETMENLDWERYQNEMDMAAEEYAFSNSESNEVDLGMNLPQQEVVVPPSRTFDIETEMFNINQLETLTNLLTSSNSGSSLYLDWLTTTRLDSGIAGDILRRIENVNPS
jgi:hypothetical protein